MRKGQNMASLYDRADIYDLFDNKVKYNAYKKHWETILKGKNIHTLLDVSIGSGNVTLPLTDLGIALSGSDLSEKMLQNCRKKAEKDGRNIILKCTDFRDISCWNGNLYDCVASTGNSLPYVNNDDVRKVLEQMDSLVRPGGFLYLDIRNWDEILRKKQRFYLYDPMFCDEVSVKGEITHTDSKSCENKQPGVRVNTVQAWDYHADGSMTFNILYAFEKDNHIFQKEIFEEHYFPISRNIITGKLREMGYENIDVKCFPAYFENVDIDRVEWHSIIARKG